MVKRRAVVILLSIMIISLFSGCSEQEIEQGLGDIGGYIQQVQDAHTETIESEQTTETDMPESEETLEELPSIYYAYHTLDKEGQKLYLEIYRSLQRMETDTAVSTLDIDELNTVFQYVLADHPELFYVEGYHRKCFDEAYIYRNLYNDLGECAADDAAYRDCGRADDSTACPDYGSIYDHQVSL